MTEPRGPSSLAEEKAELLRPIAESSADVYVDGMAHLIGQVLSEELVQRAFVDGFLTAIELLVTTGGKGSS